jgi:hypothetical protein
MIRLTYCSHLKSALDDQQLAERVSDILAASVANNREVNVTGGLIYDRNWFIQVLEGAEEDVTAVFRRIEADVRHSDITVMERAETSERRFPYWWMAAAPIDAGIATLEPNDDAEFDPRHRTAEELVGLIRSAMVGHAFRPLLPMANFAPVAARA